MHTGSHVCMYVSCHISLHTGTVATGTCTCAYMCSPPLPFVAYSSNLKSRKNRPKKGTKAVRSFISNKTYLHVFVEQKMIRGIFIVNNQGEERVIKFYEQGMSEQDMRLLIREAFALCAKRPDMACNFVPGRSLTYYRNKEGTDVKLVYRHYATLYFIFVVDQQESELGILDLIQVFVETLDKCFEAVCELDLIFNSEKVHYVLDEVIMGGMVLETNITTILRGVREMDKLEQTNADSNTSVVIGSPNLGKR